MSPPVNCQGIVTFEDFIVQIPVQRGQICVQLLQPSARFYRHFLCLRQDYSPRDFLGDLSLSEPSVRESELFTFNIKRYITFILLERLDSSSNSPPLKARTTVKCQWAGQWG